MPTVSTDALGEEEPFTTVPWYEEEWYSTDALGEEEWASTDALGEEEPYPPVLEDTTSNPFGAF